MTTLPEDLRFADLPRVTRDVISIIDDGFRRGLTQEAIQENIKQERGRGIRDDFLRQGIRFVRGDLNINPPPTTKFISRGSANLNRFALSKGPLLRNFSYQVAIVNTETGEISGRLTVVSDKMLDPEDVVDEAQESIDDEGLEKYAPQALPDLFRLEVEIGRRASAKLI